MAHPVRAYSDSFSIKVTGSNAIPPWMGCKSIAGYTSFSTARTRSGCHILALLSALSRIFLLPYLFRSGNTVASFLSKTKPFFPWATLHHFAKVIRSCNDTGFHTPCVFTNTTPLSMYRVTLPSEYRAFPSKRRLGVGMKRRLFSSA